jgi:uncharacterized protein YkwD
LRSATRLQKHLFLALVVSACLAFSGCAQVVRAHRVATAGAASLGSAEQSMVAGINNYRRAHGLPDLAVHSVLVNKARSWAAHMADGGCGNAGNGVPNICHSSLSDGVTVAWTRLEENVGMVSPRTNTSGMEAAFEHSPPHAENMLNGQVHFIGVGVAYTGNYMYVAEEFMAG